MDGLESVCMQTALIVLCGLFGYFYFQRKGGCEKAIKLERDFLRGAHEELKEENSGGIVLPDSGQVRECPFW